MATAAVGTNHVDSAGFYARLVATLYPCLDDIAPLLVDMLVRGLRFQVRKKDQVHVHSKLKNVWFIGECVCVCARGFLASTAAILYGML